MSRYFTTHIDLLHKLVDYHKVIHYLVRLETVTLESELNTRSPTLTTSTAPDLSQLTW